MARPCHGIRHGRGARGPAYQCTRHSRDESHRHAGKRNSDTRVRIESKSGRNKAIVVEVRTMATPSDQNQVRELVGCWDCSVPAPSQAPGWKAALNERLLNKRWMDGGWMDGECMTWHIAPNCGFLSLDWPSLLSPSTTEMVSGFSPLRGFPGITMWQMSLIWYSSAPHLHQPGLRNTFLKAPGTAILSSKLRFQCLTTSPPLCKICQDRTPNKGVAREGNSEDNRLSHQGMPKTGKDEPQSLPGELTLTREQRHFCLNDPSKEKPAWFWVIPEGPQENLVPEKSVYSGLDFILREVGFVCRETMKGI